MPLPRSVPRQPSRMVGQLFVCWCSSFFFYNNSHARKNRIAKLIALQPLPRKLYNQQPSTMAGKKRQQRKAASAKTDATSPRRGDKAKQRRKNSGDKEVLTHELQSPPPPRPNMLPEPVLKVRRILQLYYSQRNWTLPSRLMMIKTMTTTQVNRLIITPTSTP
jgi:hypothetical protein